VDPQEQQKVGEKEEKRQLGSRERESWEQRRRRDRQHDEENEEMDEKDEEEEAVRAGTGLEGAAWGLAARVEAVMVSCEQQLEHLAAAAAAAVATAEPSAAATPSAAGGLGSARLPAPTPVPASMAIATATLVRPDGGWFATIGVVRRVAACIAAGVQRAHVVAAADDAARMASWERNRHKVGRASSRLVPAFCPRVCFLVVQGIICFAGMPLQIKPLPLPHTSV
jgi:hypothetical protein